MECAFAAPAWHRVCYVSGIMLILEVIICAYAFGMLAIVAGMQNSPEGYEDEEGFHIRWANNSPEIRDVACVWAPVGCRA